MLKQIKFTKFGCCSAIGNFEPGMIARIDPAMAKHLVEEAGCAVFVEAKANELPNKPATEPVKPSKRKGER